MPQEEQVTFKALETPKCWAILWNLFSSVWHGKFRLHVSTTLCHTA